MPTSDGASRRAGRIVKRAVFSAVLFAGIVVLGQIPWGKSSNEAVLRLALRTVQGKIEVCRDYTAEELASLPAHMRGAQVCDSIPVTYRLHVALGGVELADELVEPGGLRLDRPHNVDREWRVSPGVTALRVVFSPELSSLEQSDAIDAGAELPAAYTLERDVDLRADRITLVFLNDGTGELDLEQG